MDKHQAGAECIRRALALWPDWPDAHNNLGNVFREQGKLDEAVACSPGVELKPDSPRPNNLGDLKDQGLDEAVACYRRALELKPDYAEATQPGHTLNGQGKLDEAAACYRRAMELKPDSAEVHNNLGIALQEQGKLDEAVACYRRAAGTQAGLRRGPQQPRHRPEGAGEARRGGGLLPPGPGTEARLRRGPQQPGYALKDQGKLDEAVACYRRALELNPDYAEAHNNLGIALKDQGKLDEAVACYRRALELKPDLPRPTTTWALRCRTRGSWTRRWPATAGPSEIEAGLAEAHNNSATP